jgi:hypothetical protein
MQELIQIFCLQGYMRVCSCEKRIFGFATLTIPPPNHINFLLVHTKNPPSGKEALQTWSNAIMAWTGNPGEPTLRIFKT